MSNKRRVNVRGILWRDGKILAVKHKEDDGSESPYWAIPGGGLDPMESLEDGVKRELMEELGINAEVGNVMFVQQFPSRREGFREELEFFFHIKDSEHFDAIDLLSTTHGHEELARVEFIDPTVESVKPRILATLDYEAAIAGSVPLAVVDELDDL